MSIRPASKSAASTAAMSSLADDLSEMMAYGSFMFLLNELRNLAAEADEDEREGEGGDDGKDLFPSGGRNNPASADRSGAIDDSNGAAQSNPFAPVLKFPLHPSAIEAVVRTNADRLIELQGERRHEAHLQMFDYFQNRKNRNHTSDEEAQTSEPIILDYNEECVEGEDHLVYSLVLDHAKRRISVVFRGSVTASDWAANRDAYFISVDNPLYVSGKDSSDSGGNGGKEDEMDENGQPRFLILHRGFYEYVVSEAPI